MKDKNEITAKLLENAVLQDLISRVYSVRNIVSYKTNNKSKNELDFLITRKQKRIPFEVKLSNKINQKSILQTIAYLQESKNDLGVIIYSGLPQYVNIKEINLHYLPPYYLSKI